MSLDGATIGIIGGGPAGLMAAERLAERGLKVDLFDAMPSVGRKFLLAGKGGLNITHSEPLPRVISRFGREADRFAPLLDHFGPQQIRDWAAGLGIETFVGTSGRVFPTDFKAAPLMRAWVRRLRHLGVTFHPNCRWTGFAHNGTLSFQGPEGVFHRPFHATLLALGGASWPRLGSDAAWITPLTSLGCAITPLRPANCGFLLSWSDHMRPHFGSPLKAVSLSFGGKTLKGEAMIADYGIEGSAVYALSADLRNAIDAEGQAVLHLDLKPDLSLETLAERLSKPRGRQSVTTWLRKSIGLPPASLAVLMESRPEQTASALAKRIKAISLVLTGPRPIDEAISSAGGLAWSELDEHLMLRRRPGIFAAGEMLDWEAPTGGYLLTACFSLGVAAAEGICSWLDSR